MSTHSTTGVTGFQSSLRVGRHAGIFVVTVLCVFGIARASYATVPNQFIAKMYTEGLGRAPDQGGWGDALNFFQQNGCSQSTLKEHGRGVYLSAEFDSLGYDNAARLLALYHGVLNREPDSGGFDVNLQLLNTGTPWADIVEGFFDSAEFDNLVGAICSGGSYYFGTNPAIAIPTSGGGDFHGGTRNQLQQLIDNAPTGGIVFLAQKAVVTVSTEPILLWGNRRLQTAGAPAPTSYALMGRIVRTGSHPVQLVKIEQSGGQLLNVWVDGQRGQPDAFVPKAANVELFGGSGSAVRSSKISNSMGWSSVAGFGTLEALGPCSMTISGNLVTAYSSAHGPSGSEDPRWTDGISISCENAIVENNTVIDATDVGIIVFSSEPAPQQSQVRFNTVLNAGNSAYGGLVADHRGVSPVPPSLPPGTFSFAGTRFHDNVIWTGTTRHIDIGLSVGTVAWFGGQRTGDGAQFDLNTSGSQIIRTDIAIGVSGMSNAVVLNNTFSTDLGNTSNCPNTGPSVVNVGVDDRYASGTIQVPHEIVQIESCVSGHSD